MIEKIGGVTLNYQFYKGEDLYSDGPIEDQMLEMCKEGRQEKALEEALESNWAMVAHFLPARENIINWYPFDKEAAVLEIGSGCGAITGVLSKNAKKVVGIELSKKRSLINAYRNQAYDNIEIYVGKYEEIQLEEKFDYVVMIGVFEYAAYYTNSNEPYKTMLGQIKRMLKPGGKLLIAIENKLGLKYWCGAPEDHTGVPFEGLYNYNKKNESGEQRNSKVRTFSKQELVNMFNETGFLHQRFYYPLPDYKFPNSIFSDTHLPKDDDIRSIKFYYGMESELVADERILYREIIQNNCFPFFANSFLAEISESMLDKRYVEFALFKRDYVEKYKLATKIWNDKSVVKQPFTLKAMEHINQIQQNTERLKETGVNILMSEINEHGELAIPYCELPLTVELVNEAFKTQNLGEIKRLLDLLKESLMQSSTMHYGYPCNIRLPENVLGEVLDIAYPDMTFINSFYDDGKLMFFDQEWQDTNLPLTYILYRAIKYTSGDTKIKEQLYLEYGIEPAIQKLFDEYENSFLTSVMDSFSCSFFDPMMYHEGLTVYPRSRKTVAELYQKNDEQSKVLAEQQAKIVEQQALIGEQTRNIQKYKEEINQQDGELNNRKAHIEQLMQTERDLNAELKLLHDSRAFRFMQILWKANAIIFPRGSRRRKIVKKILRPFGNKDRQAALTVARSIKDYEKLKFSEYDKPLVSIIIPVYNEFDYTYECLKSISDNSGEILYEIILADDCSTDMTRNIKDIVTGIIISRTEENVRFLRNCNHAAKQARGKYIIFLNNDTQVRPDWLQPLVDLLERDETIGMTGSKLIFADGTLQEAGGILWKDGSGWNYGRGSDPSLPEYNYVKDVDYISGASLMIRRELWEDIGGFDERYVPAYCEDSDLAFEVRRHGYRVVYQPKSEVVHFEGISNGTDLTSGVKQYQVVNSQKLFDKWKEELAKQYPNAVNVFRARERGQGKKVILIIDHYVPQFDKDAGSRTIWQYINLFIEKGYTVKFIGDNFYPQEPYTSFLQQMGIEVLYGSWYAKNYRKWIIDNKDNIDFAFLCRPHITEKYIDILKEKTNIKCIYWGNDLHCMRIQREYEICQDEALLAEAEDWKRREFAIMRKTDMNYYPSSVEIEEIHKVDAGITAKTFDIYVYEQFRGNISLDFSRRKGILFVGGFGHRPNEDAVLWFANQIYPIIRKQCNIPFYVVGSNPTDKVKQIGGNGIIIKGFVSDAELAELYDRCKVVVIPLRYGAGVKGKVIEALYFGAPMVTTTIGIEGISGADRFIEIADTAEVFAEKTIELYNDDARLIKAVNDYQNYIKTHCSVEAVWKNIREDFTK